jgi:hypothetical protein
MCFPLPLRGEPADAPLKNSKINQIFKYSKKTIRNLNNTPNKVRKVRT